MQLQEVRIINFNPTLTLKEGEILYLFHIVLLRKHFYQLLSIQKLSLLNQLIIKLMKD